MIITIVLWVCIAGIAWSIWVFGYLYGEHKVNKQIERRKLKEEEIINWMKSIY
jgi:hypothetical protein